MELGALRQHLDQPLWVGISSYKKACASVPASSQTKADMSWAGSEMAVKCEIEKGYQQSYQIHSEISTKSNILHRSAQYAPG